MTVIGVFERRESSLGDDSGENQLVAMPLTVYEKMYPWEEELFLAVQAGSYEEIDQAKEEIINTLRVYRKVPYGKGNNFAISTQDTFREQYANISRYIYIAMIVITSVGLMVGGIGVMNIMLVSVTERTREIGVRKAIGAKRSNIILQFLTEAITLSGSGGVIGIGFGIIVGLSLNAAFGFPLGVSFIWVTIGFVVAVSVGLVSGIYPAIKAAKLDPIEALRYE
jgi:putative ABC transport system permease protein